MKIKKAGGDSIYCKIAERKIVHSLAEIPEFSPEDEEREWWATHDLAPKLGKDVAKQQHALIQRLKAKYRYVPTIKSERQAEKKVA